MDQDRNKLDKLRSYARTAVLEQEQAQRLKPVQNNEMSDFESAKLTLFSKDVMNQIKEPVLQKREEPVQLSQQPVYQQSAMPEKAPLIKEVEETEVVEEIEEVEQPQQENLEQEEIKEVETEEVQEIEQEEHITESLFSTIEDIESDGEDVISKELSAYSNKKPKGMAFKVKLFTGVLCCLIALFGGWVIGNAVSISSVSSQIVSEQVASEQYKADLGEYLLKISQVDNWNEDNLNSDGSLIPIEEVIPIIPTELSNPTDYQKETNWFDKIINWISHLFGG